MRIDAANVLKLKRAAVALMLCAIAGCAGTEPREPSVSGNPEADMRAEQRVRGEGDGDGSSRGATLYTRLGGSETIHAIVNDMTERVLADPRVNFQRKDVQTSWLGAEYDAWEPTPERVARFKRRMVEFIELAAGGPAEYSGRNMKTVHEGMRITNIEFDAFVGDMTASMNRLGIGTAEQRDLLAIIESTRKQIVEEP